MSKLKGGKLKSQLRGGEVLSAKKNLNMPRPVLDGRYYPFKDKLAQNISTMDAEYQVHNVKNIDSNVHEFEVDKASAGFIDLKNSYVLLRHKLQVGGTDPDTVNAFNGAYKQNLSLLMYNDCKTYLNNREVNDEHDTYLTPYSWLHKTCLMEENAESPHLVTDYNLYEKLGDDDAGTTPTIGNAHLHSIGDKRVIYEDLYDIGTQRLRGAPRDQPTLSWKSLMYHRYNCYDSGIQTVIRPRDGIWQNDHFLPPDTQIRLQLTTSADEKIISTTVANVTNSFISAQLFLRRVYPHQETLQSIMALSKRQPRVYPVVNSRTTYFNIPTGTTSLDKVGLLSGSKPSVIVVQFVREDNFIANTGNGYAGHPFNADQFKPLNTGKPENPEVSVSSLYVRVGSKRYPRNYEYSSENNNLGMGYNEYNEYVRACKTTSGDTAIKPFLGPSSRSLQMYFINTRENNETMWDKVDEPTGMDSIELHCRLNSATTQDMVCVVSALSNGALTISPDGRVDKIE